VSSLSLYVSHIIGYRRLMSDVESKRRTLYSSDNEEHEALLMQVCKLNGHFSRLYCCMQCDRLLASYCRMVCGARGHCRI